MNASCEGNKDRFCKTMRKIFHFNRHNKRPSRGSSEHKPCGNKQKPCGNKHKPCRIIHSQHHVEVQQAVFLLMMFG